MKNLILKYKTICHICLKPYEEIYDTCEPHTHMITYNSHSIKYLPSKLHKNMKINKLFKTIRHGTHIVTNKYYHKNAFSMQYPYIYVKKYYTCECGIKDFSKDKILYFTLMGSFRK